MHAMTVRLILASSSPRRRQLLAEAGYAFDVLPPDPAAEGGVCSGEAPSQLVARLALQKAANVAHTLSAGLVIGCDTVAECCGQVLGKPRDREDARQMLTLLSGREHRVHSGLCLWRRPDDAHWTCVDVTRLVMDPLSPGKIDAYLAADAWVGKAGAFGYQDGLDWVHVVAGSQSNVVGLPLELLERMLAEFPGPSTTHKP
jgi:septum formation protein